MPGGIFMRKGEPRSESTWLYFKSMEKGGAPKPCPRPERIK